MREDIYASLTVPELVNPNYMSEEDALLSKKHKYLGQYIAELARTVSSNNDNSQMITRQMRSKLNNTAEKVAAMDSDLSKKVEKIKLEVQEAADEISEMNNRMKKSKI